MKTRVRRSVCLCVGIAASHGNLASLASVLQGLPAEMGLSVVVLLSGDATGHPAASAQQEPTARGDRQLEAFETWHRELKCPLPIEVLERSTRLLPNCVYVAVKPMALSVSHGTLHVAPLPPPACPRQRITFCLRWQMIRITTLSVSFCPILGPTVCSG